MGSSRLGISHNVFFKKTSICPYCGKSFKSLGISNHRSACMKKPKYRGTGIHVHEQTFTHLIKGDTFFDADFGMMEWDGKKWQQQDDNRSIKKKKNNS